ncbi:KpsF/GutQ family sugar-phosphate isomerase [Fervidibacter sacchari]|uniref:Arabinose-5-phosphate isomerase n=1 Tax=Candidatus Fervidibacter sacchari TaxID=1448929 RepID=A0ABT2EI75_9BACT|nr:KpsF/GutQ family sugar-phosphate isomerase [Candidatus Fervidibacter sacchari]MCS3917622.1 arabinose-5-phosphate isomerase [Candidatus Fervidibacter sacchari]WKU15454.1 KpsF/GutQ family sugar-phosphate isomerase [Candidatus Fervidibacter sacchari]
MKPLENTADLSDIDEIRDLAREVFQIEAEAIRQLSERVGAEFEKAVQILLSCKGHVVVTGMGKSGAIGRKIAATLSSTGTPALFLHPAEGVHGDLGAITPNDVVLALSYSGETDELLAILPAIKRLGVPLIVLTGNINSTLAKAADVVLDVSVKREACPLNLAPTASAAAMLAMGDALALAAMKARRFTPEDFARLHPAGTLGRRLLLKVKDLMRTGERMARVHHSELTKAAFAAITKARAGACVVVDDEGKLCGIVTDGDLRRALLKDVNLFHAPVTEVMTKNPKVIHPEALATEALRLMQTHQIDDLPVVDDDGRPIGMLDVQDLLQAGIV